MFKYIVIGGSGFGRSHLFFCGLTPNPSPRGEGNLQGHGDLHPTPAPPLKGAGSCEDHNDDHNDNDDDDGG